MKRAFVILALALLPMASARASLTFSVSPNTISAGAITDDATLANFVSQDLVITTDTDWLSAQLRIYNIAGGTIYQNTFGGDTSPIPSLFSIVASLEYDTYVSNGVVGQTVSIAGGAVDIGGNAAETFSTTELDIAWFTTDTDDTGTLPLTRVTLGNMVSGDWSFRASNAGDELFSISGTIVNGALVPEPGTVAAGLVAVAVLAWQILRSVKRRSGNRQ